MLKGRFLWRVLGAWLIGLGFGCASTPQPPPPPAAEHHFNADAYDAHFEAAGWTLRDLGFRLARNDRRFGVITTYPKESPTSFEPWLADNTTRQAARRSTYNRLRRRVTATIQPAEGEHPGRPPYRLTVRVELERQQEPSRYLTHSARSRVTAHFRDVPAHYAGDGIPGLYWEPAGEDPALARQLLDAITTKTSDPISP